MKKKTKNIAGKLLIIFILIILIESLTSLLRYHANRTEKDSFLVTIDTLNYLTVKPDHRNEYKRFNKLLELRKRGKDISLTYTYDPQLHLYDDIYYLSNVNNTKLLHYYENDKWITFVTDEIGFRNPKGSYKSLHDYILIGDSFAEGAGSFSNDTIAGLMRQKNRSVYNLGRSNSGPLFQYALLREYIDHIKSKEVLWFIFTGNDLHNLREEKTTKLSNYLIDENYKQDLLINAEDNSKKLNSFLEDEIIRTKLRVSSNFVNPYNRRYGETLDTIGSESDLQLLGLIIKKIKEISENNNRKLSIVLLNHYGYNVKIQELTSRKVIEVAQLLDITLINFTRDRLTKLKDKIYSKDGAHFNSLGNELIQAEIIKHLDSK